MPYKSDIKSTFFIIVASLIIVSFVYPFSLPASSSNLMWQNNIDTEIVEDGSFQGVIDTADDLYEPDDGNDPNRNFELFFEMDEGDIVYVRVSAYDAGSYEFFAKRFV